MLKVNVASMKRSEIEERRLHQSTKNHRSRITLRFIQATDHAALFKTACLATRFDGQYVRSARDLPALAAKQWMDFKTQALARLTALFRPAIRASACVFRLCPGYRMAGSGCRAVLRDIHSRL